MFSAVARITPVLSSPIICRYFARFHKKVPDPGVTHRRQALALNESNEIVDYDDFESDFMNVHQSHKEHLEELRLLKEQEKYFIVKQKYFKEKYPNFLTWHDKEQIRYLYTTNPEEWTIEKLSDGFPASPDVIKKIVKGNWTKKTQDKITNHDAAVQKNWKLFKEGKFDDLPKDLVEHLKKFTSRALNLQPFEIPKNNKKTIVESKKNIKTEFSDIIASYEKLKNNVETTNENLKISAADINKPPEDGTYMKKSTRRKPITLSELQHNLTKQLEVGKNIDENEMLIVKSSKVKEDKPNKMPQTVTDEIIELSQNKFQTPSMQRAKTTEKDLSHLIYPEKINIPKGAFKKGCIYKLNDCFYDDDGEFLYRVPGMVS